MEKQTREEREHHWQFIDREEKKEREPFRRDDRTVDRDRELAELTRMIGYLTLLRRKTGLLFWKKGTSPIVRERVMDILAAAAYASGTERDVGFRGLWKKVKPADKPDEGVPFDTVDAIFNSPVAGNGRGSYYETNPPSAVPYDPKGASVNVKAYIPANSPQSGNEHKTERTDRDRDQDFHLAVPGVRWCMPKVEELKKGERGEVIKEFRLKCLSSQELIAAQIPWATAGAERSRREKNGEMQLLYGETNDATPRTKDKQRTETDQSLSLRMRLEFRSGVACRRTNDRRESCSLPFWKLMEKLLAALVQYYDLERVAIERNTEEKSQEGDE
ncbi:hypothetical protein BT96DRAFT_943554 [Gymnopus androsaceus JB14]|uniref:Ig-like domain-containing protein n=1 Tax=Gymnopus androsaceus JB14 TaxID=1447944 RepID=A0A6A4H8G6_9AGAR|nr:hypothetical protein BT96DRAFT_943554 [Gymnopus androsaceus JB14]